MKLNDPTMILLLVAIVLDLAVAFYTASAARVMALMAMVLCIVALVIA